MANIYLNFPGINGDVTLSGHEGWIEVRDLHWGIARVLDTTIGGAANRVKSHPQITEVTLTKFLDNSSPGLFDNLLTDSTGVEAEIHIVSSADAVYCSYTLENCLVGTINTTAGGDKPMEVVTLNFTKFTVSYNPTDASGNQGAPIRQGFDVATGTKSI